MTTNSIGLDTKAIEDNLKDMGIKDKLGRDDIMSIVEYDDVGRDIITHMIVEVEHFTSSLQFASEFRYRLLKERAEERRKTLDKEMEWSFNDEDVKIAMIKFFCCDIKPFEVSLFKEKYSRLNSAVSLNQLMWRGENINLREESEMRPFQIISFCM